ncbi:MAG: FAD-binding oxidoreductase [Chromatiales bacterium]|nr:FAD-binding oxidoreductase [Chromatiales bacterium]
MASNDCDTLIIGQGLAGSALAWQLAAAGQRVCVIDDGHTTSSSVVAAGLINPLAGLRFTRRPEVGTWLDAADRWYAELAHTFGRIFFHALPMLRLFRSVEQRRFHERRLADPASRELLGAAFDADHCPEPVSAPHGGFIQRRTGYVDMPLLLGELRTWLIQHQQLVESALNPAQVELGEHAVSAAGVRAQRLVFCDGARLRANPWFNALPLVPEKGEILNLVSDDWQPHHIINGAYWLVPLESGEMRFGATHRHKQIDDRITAAGRTELVDAVQALRPASPPARVVRQQAGIRPGTVDRYPLIGQHAVHPRLWVFNGFGARGALVIPWYAQCLADHLQHGTALPAEADIRRFT